MKKGIIAAHAPSNLLNFACLKADSLSCIRTQLKDKRVAPTTKSRTRW